MAENAVCLNCKAMEAAMAERFSLPLRYSAVARIEKKIASVSTLHRDDQNGRMGVRWKMAGARIAYHLMPPASRKIR